MANLNKVILIGRLTGNAEVRSFQNGGKVAKFSFAINERKKNSQSGEWEDSPVYIDIEAYNKGEFGKLADTIEKYCVKGAQICIEGKLSLDKWDDKTTGQRRSKHKVIADAIQLLDSKKDREEQQPPRQVENPNESFAYAVDANATEVSDDEVPF